MAERPILFSGPMVRAILAGKKTQTRRIVTPQPEEKPPGSGHWYARPRGYDNGAGVKYFHTERSAAERLLESCAPYAKGDTLWIRETHAIVDPPDGSVLVVYRASCENDCFTWVDAANSEITELRVARWTPAIFMRKELARTARLRVTSVRVERLQEIDEADVVREGLTVPIAADLSGIPWSSIPDLHTAWRYGWDAINGKRAPWESNPWVWVLSFELAEAERA